MSSTTPTHPPTSSPGGSTGSGGRSESPVVWFGFVAAISAIVALIVTAVVGTAGPSATAQTTTPAADAAAPGGATADNEAAAPAAEPVTAPAIFRDPTDVGTPVGDRGPQNVSLELETQEVQGQLADGTAYDYWTFNGTVPGPLLRVRVGDTVTMTLTNGTDSENIHSIDMHAVNGPGGGAKATQVPPGESRTFTFTPLAPGVFVYHCASPHIPSHIANGMFGMIVVEPEGGLPAVDHEFYVMQSEIYTAEPRGTQGLVTYDGEKMVDENPTYVVFNGAVNALTGDNAMQVQAGDSVRLFFGDAGPNKISSFHVIGEIMDEVHTMGAAEADHNIQTTLVPAGGAMWTQFTVDVPGDYLLVDHAITRTIDKGALAIIHAEGEANPAIFDAPPADAG
jgi:nitrite reductase (NO-forming)